MKEYYSPFERELITKIVCAKKSKNIRGMSLPDIIYEELDVYGVRWDLTKNTLTLYFDGRTNDSHYNRFRLFEIISILKHLEDNGLMFVNDRGSDDNIELRDADKYIYDPEDDRYDLINDNGSHQFLKQAKNTIYGKNIAQFTARYNDSQVFPSVILEDLVAHEFKTPEQIRFEEQLEDANTKHKEAMDSVAVEIGEAKKQTKWSIGAFVVSFVGLVAALTIPFCTSTKIDEESTKEIEKIIQENKVVIPETINTNITNDTLKVDVVKTTPNKR